MATGLAVKRKQTETGFRVLLMLASFIVVIAGLRAASELLVPVALGFFLAVLSLPILKFLNGHGFPRPLAVLMTIGFDLMILLFLLSIASSTLGEFRTKSPDYASALKVRVENIAATVDTQVEKLTDFFDQEETESGSGETEQPEPDESEQRTFNELVVQYWDNKIILDVLGQTELLGRITSLASKSFLVLIIMIFVLAESGGYAQKIKEVIRVRGPDLRQFQNSSRDLQKYLAIKTGASAATGLLAWLSCTLLGVDFPVLWGLVAFVFNYIPAIGSILAAIPPIILALIEKGFWSAAGILACYLAINIAIGNFIEPMLMGDRFGLSTLVVILSVFFWGFVWGPVGMFLAVPLTMLVKVMLDNSTDLQWISVMMGKPSDLRPRRRRRRKAQAAESDSKPEAGPPPAAPEKEPA